MSYRLLEKDYFNKVCSYRFFYLEKLETVFIELSEVSKWKFELVIFVFLNGPCSTYLTWEKKYTKISGT